jgi:hypothetical protein
MKTRDDIKLARFKEAYLAMVRCARYRPGAPSDGLGNIYLSARELRDPVRLDEEAAGYAEEFYAEEDTDTFFVGCSDFETNQAFVWTIEAARCLAAGAFGKPTALKLLEMAIAEIKRRNRDRYTRTKARTRHELSIG